MHSPFDVKLFKDCKRWSGRCDTMFRAWGQAGAGAVVPHLAAILLGKTNEIVLISRGGSRNLEKGGRSTA